LSRPSEYDPVVRPPDERDVLDLERARELFETASRPYLSSPFSWLAWALVLPAAALLSPRAYAAGGPLGAVAFWSVAIMVGGAVEAIAIRRRTGGRASSGLAGWSLRAQANLSLVALALSVTVVLTSIDLARLVPGIWLLLLGHSLYVFGGLAFRPMRACGLLYQAAGIVALWPRLSGLGVFAAATFLGNLWMAISVWRRRRSG